MDDVVAVAVEFSEVGTRYFLAYGRILGDIDADAVEAAVLKSAQQSDYGGTPLKAKMCRTLHEASSQPFFFESFFQMARDAVSPDSRWSGRWKRRIGREMNDGRECRGALVATAATRPGSAETVVTACWPGSQRTPSPRNPTQIGGPAKPSVYHSTHGYGTNMKRRRTAASALSDR